MSHTGRSKKLSLNKTTIVSLSNEAVGRAAGGFIIGTIGYNCPNTITGSLVACSQPPACTLGKTYCVACGR